MDRRGISTGLATHAETPRGAEPCGGAGGDRRKKGSQTQKRSRHSSTLMSACNEHGRLLLFVFFCFCCLFVFCCVFVLFFFVCVLFLCGCFVVFFLLFFLSVWVVGLFFLCF